MKKPLKITLKILQWTVLSLLLFILAINMYFIIAQAVKPYSYPTLFGYSKAVVESGSMEPRLSKGDFVIYREQAEYAEHDIVIFTDSNGNLVTHRIIEVGADTITTQGDANNTPDEPISASVIHGKVVAVIPILGSVLKFLATPYGIILIVLAAFAIIALPDIIKKIKGEQ